MYKFLVLSVISSLLFINVIGKPLNYDDHWISFYDDPDDSDMRVNFYDDSTDTEDIPEENPGNEPEDIPEENPEYGPENNSEENPEYEPENNSEENPEYEPENNSEDEPEDIPEENPEYEPENNSENGPEDIPEENPEYEPENNSEDEPEENPENRLENNSEDEPENNSENEPEDIPEENPENEPENNSVDKPEKKLEDNLKDLENKLDNIVEKLDDLIEITAENRQPKLIGSTTNVLIKEVRSEYLFTKGIGAHKLHLRRLSWNKARKVCIDEGAQLADIRSDSEEKILLQMLVEENVNVAWVGYHDIFEEGDWVSVLGEPLGKSGWDRWWKKRLPNPDNVDGQENCAGLMRDGGGMNDHNCRKELPFICKIIDL